MNALREAQIQAFSAWKACPEKTGLRKHGLRRPWTWPQRPTPLPSGQSCR